MNPLNKIIFLSAFLATGFLLILLSCALFGNWRPLFVVLFFLVAPIPNALFNHSNDHDILADTSSNPIKEFGQFLTGFFIVSGLGLPLVLYHVALIELSAMVMSMAGGLTVYGTIIAFGLFFSSDDDDYNF